MGLWGLSENSGEPRFFEVYASSSRLAFSRYFVVAHVDGFLYVLDKYFCISRLVPTRISRCASQYFGHIRQEVPPANGEGGDSAPSHSEPSRGRGEDDDRPAAADERSGVDLMVNPTTEGDREGGGARLVPVRIADIFSALFRSDKPVFSQLLTGSNQYDQRQLQSLRQKSLLLSNRRDGCLYLFLKKFLLRVSLRGTVTVVADLHELALAAASRLLSGASAGVASSGNSSTPPTHSQHMGDDEGGPGSAIPLYRVSGLRHYCEHMGYDQNASLTKLDCSAQCTECAPSQKVAPQSTPLNESPAAAAARSQVWHKLRVLREQLQSLKSANSFSDGSSCGARLQDFISCRGRSWEVNNCCIDGEGRCFYTVTQTTARSALQQRGMIFCLDTQGPAIRSRALQFGRGVTEGSVLSLSLAAHPIRGCFLVVAKSASSIRGGILSPLVAPLVSEDMTCAPLVKTASVGNGSSGADRGSAVSPEGLGRTSSTPTTRTGGAFSGTVTTTALQKMPEEPDSGNECLQTRASEGLPDACVRHGTSATFDDDESVQPDQPQHWLASEGPLESTVGVMHHSDSVSDSQANREQAPCSETDTWHTYASSRKPNEAAADEHSTWWFCPCEEDPTFYFPVSECLHDEAAHSAAQSVCRQFRGTPSSSVCRAYFGEDNGVAVKEATAAVTAARTAELIVVSAAEAMARRDPPVALCGRSASLPADSAKGFLLMDPALQEAASQALKNAALACAQVEAAACRGYILWQPGVKVRRPKTGEEAISFGSALLIRARATECPIAQKVGLLTRELLSQKPQRALESIYGEVVAVISQDARHLEVRDALPSPLGFIVVPAEAANRIVKHLPDGIPGRSSSRNQATLGSFLASFVAGSSAVDPGRDDAGFAPSRPGTSGSGEGRGVYANAQGVSAEAVATGTVATSNSLSTTTDSVPQRSIPAVNIVFLVDTLRLCRFAEARLGLAAQNVPGQKWDCNKSVTLAMRDKRLLGLSEADGARCASRPLFEGFESCRRPEAGLRQSPTCSADDSSKQGLAVDLRGGQRCSCKIAGAGSAEACRASVLHSHFADVLLQCADGFEIASHRALLAARCSFFEAKLTRTHWEAHRADKVVIDLRSFPGSVVQTTVHYFETGSFVIPAACCCPVCCMETRRHCLRQKQTLQSTFPPYESQCCCKVDWVLQAYTFAGYCLLEDLQAELLAVLARLISQRTCLYVLTHPAVRNQHQILQLAAHQLVQNLPMPNLLLDAGDSTMVDGERFRSPKEKRAQEPPGSMQQSSRDEEHACRDTGRTPLLPLLLLEGIYEVIVTALSAWVLLIRYGDKEASTLRSRELLVLLALRLLQETTRAPSTWIGLSLECTSPGHSPCIGNPTFVWENNHTEPKGNGMIPPTFRTEKMCLLVPLRSFRETVKYFLFRDVVLLWAKLLQVPEQDAKAVAQGAEDLGLP